MTHPSLHIENLTLTIADKVLIRNLNVDLPDHGIVGLMGPMGVGKSSLISWLCGTSKSNAFKVDFDQILLGDIPLCDENRPLLLPQKAAHTAGEALSMLENMRNRKPALICVDEVTATLEPQDAATVLEWLEDASQTLPILMISHNQLQLALHADQIILLAAGRLQEVTPAKQFFTAPTSEAGRQFIRTGNTTVISPEANPRHMASDLREVPAHLELVTNEDDADPTLHWIVREKLAVFNPLSDTGASAAELEALSERGVSSVIVLDHETPPDLEALAEAGLVGVWFPMDPACTPKLPECKLLCHECDRLLKEGQKVAVLTNRSNQDAERTIGAQLVHMGLPAGEAAHVMREAFRNRPLSVEDEQLLWDLELSNDLDETQDQPKLRGRAMRKGHLAIAKGNIHSFKNAQTDRGNIAAL